MSTSTYSASAANGKDMKTSVYNCSISLGSRKGMKTTRKRTHLNEVNPKIHGRLRP